jgi:hypothetical protein
MERQKFIYFGIPWLTWETRQAVEEVTFFTVLNNGQVGWSQLWLGSENKNTFRKYIRRCITEIICEKRCYY